MASEDGTGCQAPPEAVILCANGCGFFGSAATMNLCSVCFRDFRAKQERNAAAKAAMTMSLNPSSAAAAVVADDLLPAVLAPIAVSSSNEAVQAEAAGAGAKTRCAACRKRVGLTGFACRCGSTFCGAHRYPEEHACEFDYKAGGRAAIARANPVMKGEKLEDRV